MSLSVSAPGRVCLFGEHQDYLGLPVIPCAVSLRIRFHGDWSTDGCVSVDLPDIGSRVEFALGSTEIPYSSKKDYFKSVYNILIRRGYSFSRGICCTVSSEIPINAGTSSSSAMVVGWVYFLALMSDQQKEFDPLEIAEIAYLAEVSEFGEYGGMMDQYSSAVGGVIHLSSFPDTFCRKLSMNPGDIILADSGQPKNTQGMLGSVRHRAENLFLRIPSLNIHNSLLSEIVEYESIMSSDDYSLLWGILRNRDITCDALKASSSAALGALLTEEHAILRDVLGTSTSKIDGMVDAALNAGALGAKINGSGGGGCMFATADSKSAEGVAEALRRTGGKVWSVKADIGVAVEEWTG